MLGKEFYSKVILLSDDEEVFPLDPANKIPAGVYIVVARSANAVYAKKLVVR